MAGCEFNVNLELGAFEAHKVELSQQHPDWTPELLQRQALIDFNAQMFPAQVKSWLAEQKGETVMQSEVRYLEKDGRLVSEFYGPFQKMIDAATSDEEREILTAFELEAIAAKPGEEIIILDASAIGRGGGVKYLDVFKKEIDGSVKHQKRVDLTGDGPDLSLGEAKLKLEQLGQEALKEKIAVAAAEAIAPAVLPVMPEPEQWLALPAIAAPPQTQPALWSIARAVPARLTETIIRRSIGATDNFNGLGKTDSNIGGQVLPVEAENGQVLNDEIKSEPVPPAEPETADTIRRSIGVNKKEANCQSKDNQVSNQNSDQRQNPRRKEKASNQIEKSIASRLKAKPEIKPETRVLAKPIGREKESRPKSQTESRLKGQPRPAASEKHESKIVFFSRKPKLPSLVKVEQPEKLKKPTKLPIPKWELIIEPFNDKEIPIWQPIAVYNFNATILLLSMFWLILNTKIEQIELI